MHLVNHAGYGPAALRALLAQPDTPREVIRRFLLQGILLNRALTRAPCADLVAALRFQVTTKTLPEFGRLPLTCISLGLSTARPSDEEIIELIDDEGVERVFEVLGRGAVDGLCDPLKAGLLAAVGASAGRRPSA
jgi:hypothetical protein